MVLNFTYRATLLKMHGAIRCIIYDFILVVLERLVTVITLSCTVLRYYAFMQCTHREIIFDATVQIIGHAS